MRENTKLHIHLKKGMFTVLGTFFLGLGLLGIFIPLLPTTPFLLLALACYLNGSKKMTGWILNNRWFGGYIRDYKSSRGIPLKVKIFALTFLWLTIGLSLALWLKVITGRLILLLIAIVVSWHILSIKTKVSPE